MNYKKTSKLFKALSDSKRLEILHSLKNNEKCACDLLEIIDLSQPTLSHHMKILEEAEIIESRKQGKWTFYSINKETFKIFKDILESFIDNNI